MQSVLTFTCPISCQENEEVENTWDGKYLEPSGKKTGSLPHLKKGKVTKVGLIDKSERRGKEKKIMGSGSSRPGTAPPSYLTPENDIDPGQVGQFQRYCP